MLLRHIRYLLAVAEHRNFTRAAEALRRTSDKSLVEKDLMLNEMKHRIKNSITRVLAIARQTAANAAAPSSIWLRSVTAVRACITWFQCVTTWNSGATTRPPRMLATISMPGPPANDCSSNNQQATPSNTDPTACCNQRANT